MLEESDSWPPQTPPPQKRSRLRAGDRDDIKQESMTHPDTTDEFPMPNVTNYLMDNPPNPVIAQATGDTVAEMYRNLEQCNMRVQAAKFRKEINDIVYKYELEIAEAMNQR
uniref:Uncharacterized protein n=1 Tax=Steinernema glaseri TaxID=37863 RepID=A0A1I7YSE5_9BILA